MVAPFEFEDLVFSRIPLANRIALITASVPELTILINSMEGKASSLWRRVQLPEWWVRRNLSLLESPFQCGHNSWMSMAQNHRTPGTTKSIYSFPSISRSLIFCSVNKGGEMPMALNALTGCPPLPESSPLLVDRLQSISSFSLRSSNHSSLPTTVLLNVPIPSMTISILSPTAIGPIPEGVPVAITSPAEGHHSRDKTHQLMGPK